MGAVVSEEGGPIYKTMKWGLIPFWAKDEKIGNSLINARVETVAEKPAFRSAFKARRCLIPASGWYEWKTLPSSLTKKPLKQPFYITSFDGQPLTFAGLWERWREKEGLLSCTILTTAASENTHDLHGRMPLVLDAAGMTNWLAGAPPQLAENVDNTLKFYPVSPRMNKPGYNAPDCVESLMAQELAGGATFQP